MRGRSTIPPDGCIHGGGRGNNAISKNAKIAASEVVEYRSGGFYVGVEWSGGFYVGGFFGKILGILIR